MKKARRLQSNYLSRLCLTPTALLFISSAIYFAPIFYGEGGVDTFGGRYVVRYQAETFWVAVLALASITLIFIAFPPRALTFRMGYSPNMEASVIFAFWVLLAAYTVTTSAMFSADKALVLEATNRAHTAFFNLNSIAFLFCLLIGWKRHRFLFLASLAGLAFAIFVGHRSYLALALVGAAYVFFRNTSVLKVKLIYGICGGLAVVGLVLYKSIYVWIKRGDFQKVNELLQWDNLFESVLVGIEPVTTSRILDYVIFHDFSLACSNLAIVPLLWIPFLDGFLETARCSFNSQMQPTLMGGYHGGVAANIWAEFYSVFGIFGIPILVVVLLGLARIVEYIIQRIRSPVLVSAFILAIVQLTFYVQRNELATTITLAKRAVIVALIIWAIASLLQQRKSSI